MIQPALKDEALLADIRTASRNDHHFRLCGRAKAGPFCNGRANTCCSILTCPTR